MEDSSSYPSPPPSASAPSIIQDHQTPIQAHYSNIPKIRRKSRIYTNTDFQTPSGFLTPNPPTGSAVSASSSSSSHSEAAVTDAGSASVANSTQYSNTDSDDPEKLTWIRQHERRTKSNYEARMKEANYRREQEYCQEKERNERLKAEYNGTMDKINRLKAYYLKCLSSGKMKCSSKAGNLKPGPASAPLVTVKSEIILDENVLVKEEQPEPDPHPAAHKA